jgi:hypothetical protein
MSPAPVSHALDERTSQIAYFVRKAATPAGQEAPRMKVDIPELTPEAKLENEKLGDELEREDERAAKRHEEEDRPVEE